MGQANAARDKLYDLRECQLGGVRGNEFDLSGVIMSKTDVSKAVFREAQFSKGYLRNSNFDGADFTNAIVDRASFKGSSLRGTIFSNAVLTATSFEGADVGEVYVVCSYGGLCFFTFILIVHLISLVILSRIFCQKTPTLRMPTCEGDVVHFLHI